MVLDWEIVVLDIAPNTDLSCQRLFQLRNLGSLRGVVGFLLFQFALFMRESFLQLLDLFGKPQNCFIQLIIICLQLVIELLHFLRMLRLLKILLAFELLEGGLMDFSQR